MADTEERPLKIRKLNSTEGHAKEPSNGSPIADVSIKEGTENDENLTTETTKNEIAGDQAKETEPSTLSKKQLKKLAKKQAWEAGKDDRRFKRREKNKERKLRKAEQKNVLQTKIANGEIVGPLSGPEAKSNTSRPTQVPLTLILDCDFNDYMTDKEIISLGAQLTRCHSDNRKAVFRSHLVISSWGGVLKKRFETVLTNNHLGWKGVRFVESDFEEAAKIMDATMRSKDGGKLTGALAPNEDENAAIVSESRESSVDIPVKAEEKFASEPTTIPEPELSLVYLSSDSPNTLEVLSPNTSYIIGGIVDKNRHKGLCYKRACERGIPTAKLPIGEYMTMQSRTVLTVNHVVEIMLKWLKTGDWGEAFLSVIPKRKEAKLKVKKGENNEQESESKEHESEEEYESKEHESEEEYEEESGVMLVDEAGIVE